LPQIHSAPTLVDRAPGLLKAELRQLGSLIIAVADNTAIPAGGALAVDREEFSLQITEKIENHPRITVRRHEITALPAEGATIVATAR
jgi:NAD(FAD)-utilizing enzyme possibly involved in translation